MSAEIFILDPHKFLFSGSHASICNNAAYRRGRTMAKSDLGWGYEPDVYRWHRMFPEQPQRYVAFVAGYTDYVAEAKNERRA